MNEGQQTRIGEVERKNGEKRPENQEIGKRKEKQKGFGRGEN